MQLFRISETLVVVLYPSCDNGKELEAACRPILYRIIRVC